MKRTPLQRKTPLKQGSKLSAGGGLKRTLMARKPARVKRTKTNFYHKPHRDFVASNPCCSCGSNREVVAHHVRKGTDGGTGIKPSDWWCVPLCNGGNSWLSCHGAIHQHARLAGRSVENSNQMLRDTAIGLTAESRARGILPPLENE